MTARLLAVSLGWLGISVVAEGIPALLLPHQLLAGGQGGAGSLGLLTLAALGLAAGLQPLAGRWSDAAGRWPVILVGLIAAVAGLLLMVTSGLVMVGSIVALLGVSVAQAGHQPLLADRIPLRWRGRGSGLKGAFDVGGAFLGFLLLGALLGAGRPGLAVLVLAALLVVPFGIAYGLLRRPAVRARPALDEREDGSFVTLVATRFLFLLAIYVVGRFLLLFVAARFGLPADEAAALAGLLLAMLALATVVASVPAGFLADRLGRGRLMLGGGIAAGLGIGLMPLASSPAAVAALGTLMALGSAAFSAGNWAALVDRSPPARAGWHLGLANLGTAGAAALAGVFGLVIDAWGFDVAFGLAAACAMVGGLLAWRGSVPGSASERRAVEVAG